MLVYTILCHSLWPYHIIPGWMNWSQRSSWACWWGGCHLPLLSDTSHKSQGNPQTQSYTMMLKPSLEGPEAYTLCLSLKNIVDISTMYPESTFFHLNPLGKNILTHFLESICIWTLHQSEPTIDTCQHRGNIGSNGLWKNKKVFHK